MAAEHIVGGQMNQARARAGAGPRNISGADRVHRVGAVRVGLRRINGGVGRAVDPHVAQFDDALAGGWVRNVPLSEAQRQHGVVEARSLGSETPADQTTGAGYNNSVPHGFRVWHAGLGYGLPGVSAISLVEATELNGVPFVPAVPPAGPVASVRRAMRVVSTLVAIAIILSTGLAWGKFKSFENGILHISSPLLGAGGDDGAIDILLVGLDSRTDAHGNPLSDDELAKLHAGDDVSTNTDTIILVRIPNNGQSATAISIPRDSYVQAPGLGKTKINGVYGQTREQKRTQLVESGVSDAEANAQATEAGREALIKTVADLTGVTVDHYAEIGLLGFALITDAIGGVDVCLKDAVYEPLSGANAPAGWQRLNGPQALSFVRQRHDLPRGAPDRVVRQQAVMASLAHEVISGKTLSSPATPNRLQGAIQRSVVLSEGWDIMDFILQLQKLAAGNVAFATIPILQEAGWSDDGMQSVVRVDPSQVKNWVAGLLHDQAQGKTEQLAYTPSKTTVDVVNDTNVNGLAAAVSHALTNKGFAAGNIGNNDVGHVTGRAREA